MNRTPTADEVTVSACSPVQFWTGANGAPKVTAAAAARAEADGWDGIWVPDSQSLTGDPYVALALAAQVTTRLKLSTGVTNPVTRHPAVTATSIATVNEESDGRAVLGIGRGDSALAYIGLAPAPLRLFIDYVDIVQRYLRLQEVDFGATSQQWRQIPSVDSLGLGKAPEGSALRWLRHGKHGKVPIEIAASGPKVIAASALVAERLTFSVGADPVRVGWAIDIAREARAAAGLDPDAIEFGVMVGVAVDRSRAEAKRLIAESSLRSLMRFSVMQGTVTGPASSSLRKSMEGVRKGYDMNKHGRVGKYAGETIDDEAIDSFSIAGPASYCVDRLLSIVALGVTNLHIISTYVDPAKFDSVEFALSQSVIPGVREQASRV